MRVLISSNSLLGQSGYSTQSAGIARSLQRMGHEVSFYSWYGLETGQLDINGIRVYPRLDDNTRHGTDAYLIAKYDGADACLTLQDIWVLPPRFAERFEDCAWLAYFPVDSEPAPPVVVQRAKTAHYPVVYSRFGQEMMRDAGLECAYVPHAIDTETFRPHPDRDAHRKTHGVPDGAFVVSMVATNIGYPSRKSYAEALEAFARFQCNHPEAILYLHTNRNPNKKGIWLDMLAQQLGIPKQAVRFIDQVEYALGLPDSYVAEVYQFSDVLLAPSMGEGFGLPIAEAQACGTPVITQNVTSMAELTVNGVAVEPLQRMYTLLNAWQYVASIERVHEALETVYGWSEDERRTNSERGVRFIQNNYSWPVVGREYWQPLFERIEGEVKAKENGRVIVPAAAA